MDILAGGAEEIPPELLEPLPAKQGWLIAAVTDGQRLGSPGTYRPFSRIASQRLPMRGSPRVQLPIRRVARIDVDEGDGFGGNGQGKST